MILAERYQIVRPLAQGGFGKTFLAYDRHLPRGHQCVIKQLLMTSGRSLQTAQRLFDLEAKTLYRLGSHPQIPTLLAHFEQNGEFYLVQDYIPGDLLEVELAQLLLDAPARTNYTYRLLEDLLAVLAFVHQQNVIHRDLKPANIIRRAADQRLVLIDFGAVKLSTSGSSALTVAIGSPGYMAPEQQAGRPCFASDLYAAGMIALQSLTGLSLQQIPIDPRTGKFQLEASAGSALLSFIQQLARSDPEQRFPDATAARQALIAIDDAVTPVPPPPIGLLATTLPPSPAPPAPAPSPRSENHFETHFENHFKTPSQQGVVSFQNILAAPLSASDYRNRQALMNKVHRFWIQGVLDHSLHGQVLLTLGLEERMNALALPWNVSWQRDRSVQPLDAGTRVYDVFKQLGEGRSLLILGEPGAGKTTALLTLARDLLQHSAANRIPAIFNLSSWTGGPIDQWLIAELNSKYQIPKAIGQAWVSQQQLLLLLDGLDEVRQDRQDSCAAALNRFYQDYGPEIVVCCRLKDYEALTHRLGFQSALYVRSLSDEQIWQYLDQANSLTGLKSLLQRSVQQTESFSDDPSLLDLARSPLILNIMALTYQGISASEIPTLAQGENYTHQLFSAYIERMFQRRDLTNAPRYSPQQTCRWLQTLATHLTNTSQTVFLIERMQPDWLTSSKQRWVYGALIWTSFLVMATAIGLQVVAPREIPLALIVSGAIFARIFGLYRIVPAETLRWSWQKASQALLLGLSVGPLIGWAIKIGFIQIFSKQPCLWNSDCFQQSSVLGLAFGAVLGVTYGIIRGLSGDRIATVTKPNWGIRQSAKNAFLFAAVATIAPWLTAHVLGNTSAAFWATSGLSFGLALGGGEACIKHGILRLILFCQGRIPWNYARFLDYAADRIFLQKVGGGYIFIHRLLLEHFAALPAKK